MLEWLLEFSISCEESPIGQQGVFLAFQWLPKDSCCPRGLEVLKLDQVPSDTPGSCPKEVMPLLGCARISLQYELDTLILVARFHP